MIPPSTASKINLPIIKKAQGKYVFDINGHKYLDFSGSNLTVVLGYKQYKFNNTPNFPGVSYLEHEAIKTLIKYTYTKHFRFFKNGTDAISCAIRLARHILGNNDAYIVYCGYAGSHNEYVYTFNQNGIPIQYSTQEKIDCDILVFESRYSNEANKINAKIRICDNLKEGIRGLIPENNIGKIAHGINDRWFCRDYGVEDIDFMIYGKSIANGYPMAVLTGRNEHMKRIGEIYYSTTYGGENVGLEAMLKTIKEFEKIKDKYYELYNYAKELLPQWRSFTKEEIRYFLRKGIINTGYWQVLACHTYKDIDFLSSVYKDM